MASGGGVDQDEFVRDNHMNVSHSLCLCLLIYTDLKIVHVPRDEPATARKHARWQPATFAEDELWAVSKRTLIFELIPCDEERLKQSQGHGYGWKLC